MQHIEKSRFFLVILVLAALGFSPAPQVQAQPWEVILGESNQLPDGQQYGIVSLDHIFDGGKRGVAITVAINDEVLSPSSNYGIRNFSFNTTVINPATNLLIGLPGLWTAQFGPVKLSEFGRFHITVAAEDSSQINPLVIEMYHITDDLSYSDFTVANRDNRLFAAHIVIPATAAQITWMPILPLKKTLPLHVRQPPPRARSRPLQPLKSLQPRRPRILLLRQQRILQLQQPGTPPPRQLSLPQPVQCRLLRQAQ